MCVFYHAVKEKVNSTGQIGKEEQLLSFPFLVSLSLELHEAQPKMSIDRVRQSSRRSFLVLAQGAEKGNPNSQSKENLHVYSLSLMYMFNP